MTDTSKVINASALSNVEADIPPDALRETWESTYEQSVKLAAQITQFCEKTGQQFDKIVVVPRGSYYPVNIIAREFGFGAIDLLHACITSYVSGTTQRQEFRLGQMPSGEQVKDLDLLIIEEVCETGETLQYLTEYLHAAGARSVRSGVLHYKPERTTTGYKPDWYVTQTNKWIVYPWEVNETRGKTSVVKRI